jgi:hypothetical protein
MKLRLHRGNSDGKLRAIARTHGHRSGNAKSADQICDAYKQQKA